MALHTAVANGDTVQPFLYNDWLSLFTGQMQDQPITLKTNETLQAIAGAPGAPTATPSAGTGLGIGVYKYAVTLVMADGGETLAGTQATVTTTSGNQQASLSSIPTGPTGTAKRNIYRTAVGGSTLFLAATLNDNTTTTYVDSLADATLTTHAQAPAHPSFGGSLVIKDQNGVVQFQIFSDGSMSTGAGGLTVGNTTVNGTLTVTGVSTLSDVAQYGAAVGGTFANIRYASANSAFQFMTPQSGATALKHLFVTWDGSAQQIPFSVGGQAAGSKAWVDNAGNIVIPATSAAAVQAFGTSGLQLRNGGTVFGIKSFTGTGSGTYSHGLTATPEFIAVTAIQANSTTTVGVDTIGSSSVHVNLPAGNQWPFTAIAIHG